MITQSNKNTKVTNDLKATSIQQDLTMVEYEIPTYTNIYKYILLGFASKTNQTMNFQHRNHFQT